MNEEEAIRNIRQILWRSIGSLATAPGSIRDRLLSPSLFLGGSILGLESLPERAQHELREIRIGLLSNTKTEAEASKLVERILSLYQSLAPEIEPCR